MTKRQKVNHWIHLIIIWSATIVISFCAVFYALGYEYNWITRSIQQTGILALGTDNSRKDVQVYINGVLDSGELPVWKNKVFPGQYEVIIKKSRYQPWHRFITVPANHLVEFKNIVLILEDPIVLEPSNEDIALLQEKTVNQRGLTIKENELYLDDALVTRISNDIAVAKRFPDNQHVIYQAGATLWMIGNDGFNVRKIVDLPNTTAVNFTYKENGKQLIYQQDSNVKMVQLYE